MAKDRGCAPEGWPVTLNSMTGYGGADGVLADEVGEGVRPFRWELKAVNGKTLDMRLRLPTEAETLEPAVRAALKAAIGRGNLQVSLHLDRAGGLDLPDVSDATLDRLSPLLSRIMNVTGATPPSAAEVLSLVGSMAAGRREAGLSAPDREALLAGLGRAISMLTQSRAEEGAQLRTVMAGQIETLTALAAQARTEAEAALPAHFEALKSRLTALAAETALGAERLSEEAAHLAMKADVTEELDRLDAHLETASSWLNLKAPVGRRFDFLTQELAREANTLTTKGVSLPLKQIGLDLKVVIDRLREQVQNVE